MKSKYVIDFPSKTLRYAIFSRRFEWTGARLPEMSIFFLMSDKPMKLRKMEIYLRFGLMYFVIIQSTITGYHNKAAIRTVFIPS